MKSGLYPQSIALADDLVILIDRDDLIVGLVHINMMSDDLIGSPLRQNSLDGGQIWRTGEF
jgi:hypothetical protein